MSRDMNQLHPLTKILAEAYVVKAKAKGLNVKITDCVRDKEEQNACFAKGTTSVIFPYSHHNWGLAFDICQNDKNNAYPNPSTKEGKEFWDQAIEIGRSLGLTPGGDWKKPDRPHFQLDVYGDAINLIQKYGLPTSFFKNKDYKIVTPKKPITPLSTRKKIIWLQVKLCINGYYTPITGEWDVPTTRSLKVFWKDKTDKNCTGKLCSVNCIKLLG